MAELTLEGLAKRVEELERVLALNPAPLPQKDWRTAVGMLGDDEFIHQLIAEGQAIREAERKAARESDES